MCRHDISITPSAQRPPERLNRYASNDENEDEEAVPGWSRNPPRPKMSAFTSGKKRPMTKPTAVAPCALHHAATHHPSKWQRLRAPATNLAAIFAAFLFKAPGRT